MQNIFIIVNPKSGKTRSKAFLYDILSVFSERGLAAAVQFSQHQGHARQLAYNAAKNGADLIIGSGGDGTWNEVVHGVLEAGRDTKIGYIPRGSTNDFAASLGLSTDVKQTARDLLDGQAVLLDIGSFNDRYFTYSAAFGALTDVSYNTSQDFKNIFGYFAYVLEGLKDIWNITPCHIQIRADGAVYEDDYLFGVISNSKSIGGIMKLRDEDVSMHDGMFEVILIRQPQNPAMLSNILHGIVTSDFSGSPFVYFKASDIEICTQDAFNWALDGERAEGSGTIRIRNLHHAVKLLLGKDLKF